MSDLENLKGEMKTMVACTNMLHKHGFDTQFQAAKAGLKSLTTKKLFKANEVKILNFYRFEGESNPADSAILYAIETVDGEKGTLTDAFGPYADTDVTNFVKAVESLNKKVNRDDIIE